ncbi:MAG: hypothetical protein EAX95_16360 [Candidatus Thorarchaeota archaeon]|nr:hypothetical protein [Candidatus Thorarchaeota archaeon]
MAIVDSLQGSRALTIAAVFAAMIAVLDSIPIFPGFYSGVWDSWIFMLSPVVGAVLGPLLGAASVGLGGLLGHFIYFRDPLELIFMLGAPVGAAMAGLVYQQRWRAASALYSAFLLTYFLTPVTWLLPLWGIWDVLAGFSMLLFATLLSEIMNGKNSPLDSDDTRLILSAVIGLESDILLRIFILVPCQTYWYFYGLSVEALQLLWLGAGFVTPLKVVLSAIATIAIGRPLLSYLQRQVQSSDQELVIE